MPETTQGARPSVSCDEVIEAGVVQLVEATSRLRPTPTTEASTKLGAVCLEVWGQVLPAVIRRQHSDASPIDAKITDQMRITLDLVQECLVSDNVPSELMKILESCEKIILYVAEFQSCSRLLTEILTEVEKPSDFALGMQICRLVRRGFDLLLIAARNYEIDNRFKADLANDQENFKKIIEAALGEMKRFKAGDSEQAELLSKYKRHINLRLEGLSILQKSGSVEADKFINAPDDQVNNAA
ncbi:MAG: hypothetical protein HYX68_13660 [Planctomycetes bacterium]|nr:hypothetical protein [Planctomycetota bacterium]